MDIKGFVTDENLVCNRKTYVYPIEHHYENEDEKPYIKYSCPVCESLGNKFSMTYGTSNCPLCNVNLLWDQED